MSRACQELYELGDLFCQVYDELSEEAVRHRAEQLLTDPELEQISASVLAHVEAGVLPRDWVAMCVANHRDPDAARFACLRGLDRAFAHLNPLVGAPAPGALAGMAMDAAATLRLDSGAHGGALIPRLRERGRPAQLPATRRDAFPSVLRVPPGTFDAITYERMPAAARFSRPELERGLMIACAPFVADPGELDFRVEAREAGRFYRIAPRQLEQTIQRIPAVVEAMESAGAQLGVIPELTLTPALLEEWQRVLRRARPDGTLQWILVGSGDLDGGTRPVNAAVLLDARDGSILGRQDKLNPFNFSAQELQRWSLTSQLGSTPVDEDLEPGDRLVILDAGGVRLAVLVCEDLGRVEELAALVRDVGVSLILVPVFARPIRDRRWTRTSADVHANATGSTIVVANSQVMETILGEPNGTALIVWPGDALVVRADEPHLSACARVMPDGSAHAA